MIGALIVKKSILKGYDSLNKRDLKGFMSSWHKDSVFIYPGDIYVSGTFEGKVEVKQWFKRFMDQFAEIKFEVHNVCIENPFDLIGNNVATAAWNVTLKKHDGTTVRNTGVTQLMIKAGKTMKVQDFLFNLGENFHKAWDA